MKRNLRNICLLGLTAILMSACAQEEWFEPNTSEVADPSLEIQDKEGEAVNEIFIPREAADTSVMIVSNADWTAVVDPAHKDWLTASPPSNHGNGRLLIRSKYNEGAASRSANVTITYNNTLTKTLTFTQAGAPLLSSKNTEVGMFRSVYNLTVAALSPWTAEVKGGDGTWVTLSQEDGEAGTFTVIITVERNTTGAQRQAEIEFDNEGVKESFILTQRAEVEPIVASIEDGDALTIKWNEVFGVNGYKINVYDAAGATLIRSKEIAKDELEYGLSYENGNLFEGLNQSVKVGVEIMTDDNTFVHESAQLSTHTLYDASSGDGSSQTEAYVVSNRRHLNNARYGLNGYFKQTTDIHLEDYEPGTMPDYLTGNMIPLSSASTPFTGSYDGGNFAISNLQMHISSTGSHQMLGLFGVVKGTSTKTAELKNIKLKDGDIVNNRTDGGPAASQTGTLAAQTLDYVTVDNCAVIGGRVFSDSQRNNMLGGLIGNINGVENHVTNSSNQGCAVTGWGNAGGLFGQAQGTSIVGCYNTGAVSGQQNVGGITGTQIGNGTSIVKYCYNTGKITGAFSNSANVAGVIGRGAGGAASTTHTLAVIGCFNSGVVDGSLSTAGNSYCAGVVGMVNNPQTRIENCYNSGNITRGSGATDATGAGVLGGSNFNSNVAAAKFNVLANCYNSGVVSGGYGVNGLIARPAIWTISPSYSLTGVASEGASRGNLANVSELTDAQMKSLSNFTGWDAGEWVVTGGYSYPQLINNPHVQAQ